MTVCLEAVRCKSQLGTAYSRRGDDWLGLLVLLVGWLAGQFRLKLSEADLVSGLRHSHLRFCNSSLALPDSDCCWDLIELKGIDEYSAQRLNQAFYPSHVIPQSFRDSPTGMEQCRDLRHAANASQLPGLWQKPEIRHGDCSTASHAGCDRVEWPNCHGFPEHGWPINNRRGGGLPRQAICTFNGNCLREIHFSRISFSADTPFALTTG